jgi:threonine/homoserine/homoserine lactone efflux protein
VIDLISANIWLLVKGAGIGFAVAAPVGPIGLLCIRTTLERGRIAGFCAGLGAAVADTFFGLVGVLGLTAVRDLIDQQRFWLELGGGVFLVAFGIHLALKKPVLQINGGEIPMSLWADFVKTLLLTLANPSTIISFMAVFAGVPGTARVPLALVPVLVIGVFAGSAGWWLALSGVISMIRHMISERTMIWMNRIAGGVLIVFGIYTLANVVAGLQGG